jgi:hypothetical protein
VPVWAEVVLAAVDAGRHVLTLPLVRTFLRWRDRGAHSAHVRADVLVVEGAALGAHASCSAHRQARCHLSDLAALVARGLPAAGHAVRAAVALSPAAPVQAFPSSIL